MEILFTDLDGTLLNDQKIITPGNREAIRQALDAGCRVVIASGRPLHSAQLQARRLELDGPGCYIIAYNGGIIFDCGRNEEIFRQTLAPDALCALFDEANRRGLHIQTYDEQGVLVEARCDDRALKNYCRFTELERRVIDSVRNVAPPVKALCIDEEHPENLEDFRLWANTALEGRVHCMYSSRTYLEAVPPGTSKGRAVEALCRRLGISIENAVAAGDEVNDISMIRAAGTGVAMRNAMPEVKAAADYVTECDNNHDGIAEIIRRFLG